MSRINGKKTHTHTQQYVMEVSVNYKNKVLSMVLIEEDFDVFFNLWVTPLGVV